MHRLQYDSQKYDLIDRRFLMLKKGFFGKGPFFVGVVFNSGWCYDGLTLQYALSNHSVWPAMAGPVLQKEIRQRFTLRWI